MRTAYLDNAATTPVCPEALAAFSRAAETVFANPSSLHAAGFAAERLVAESRAGLRRCAWPPLAAAGRG